MVFEEAICLYRYNIDNNFPINKSLIKCVPSENLNLIKYQQFEIILLYHLNIKYSYNINFSFTSDDVIIDAYKKYQQIFQHFNELQNNYSKYTKYVNDKLINAMRQHQPLIFENTLIYKYDIDEYIDDDDNILKLSYYNFFTDLNDQLQVYTDNIKIKNINKYLTKDALKLSLLKNKKFKHINENNEVLYLIEGNLYIKNKNNKLEQGNFLDMCIDNWIEYKD